LSAFSTLSTCATNVVAGRRLSSLLMRSMAKRKANSCSSSSAVNKPPKYRSYVQIIRKKNFILYAFE
jgi:hypothetical protein